MSEIPKWAMEKANDIHLHKLGLGYRENVAAIAAALAEERECAAQIADARADAYAEIANKHDGTPIGESATMRCGAATAIATAIRKRGEA